jgi:uncharacterized membrane protein
MGSFIELAKSKGVSNVKINLPVQRLAFSGDAKDYPDFVARLKSIYLPADQQIMIAIYASSTTVLWMNMILKTKSRRNLRWRETDV